ncbi:MAG TPA: AmmeMemoRadiSam system protein B [Burkholderiales bacterium]|nr:AmmeMemoRadiSam system protein B [Burkholderiales bacterium]
MASIRPAAVAGTFYPGEPPALDAELEELLGDVEHHEPRLGFPKVLVVPHAGYLYSGGVAARAYDELAPARGIVRRVVLLGPVHRVPVRGLAVPSVESFATPLGPVPLDREALSTASNLPQVVTSDAAHALEHSLEVQLPFLQKVLGGFSLVPFAVGTASVAEVAEVIERLWGGPETLIVISTDLSHYHSYQDARRIDGVTLDRIRGFATDIDHDEACGATPLNGMLALARRRGMSIRLLAACNSGDTAGGKGRVVGYGALALHEAEGVSRDEAGGTLLSIARDAIDSGLEQKPPADRLERWLLQAGASFVTLTRAGNLRGCIGSLQAHRPLGADVAANAAAAAFRDPRFTPLGAAEWPQCRVEVSLLSAPKPLRFADEAHLMEQLRPGEDGIILEAEGKRATFLPQVWEDIADKRAFIEHLMRKAGLPAETRLVRCRVSRYRVAKWKE